MAAEAGAGTPLLVIIGVLVGLLCGAGNGLLVAYFRLPSIVGTIGTMSLFRGIAFIILGDQAYGKYPADLAYFGQGYVWSVMSFELSLLWRRSSTPSCCMARALDDESLSLAQIQRPRAIPAFGSNGSSFSFFA
jgi:ABC-type xylose transport system permease subunit